MVFVGLRPLLAHVRKRVFENRNDVICGVNALQMTVTETNKLNSKAVLFSSSMAHIQDGLAR
jgi:hypothetical protein